MDNMNRYFKFIRLLIISLMVSAFYAVCLPGHLQACDGGGDTDNCTDWSEPEWSFISSQVAVVDTLTLGYRCNYDKIKTKTCQRSCRNPLVLLGIIDSTYTLHEVVASGYCLLVYADTCPTEPPVNSNGNIATLCEMPELEP